MKRVIIHLHLLLLYFSSELVIHLNICAIGDFQYLWIYIHYINIQLISGGCLALQLCQCYPWLTDDYFPVYTRKDLKMVIPSTVPLYMLCIYEKQVTKSSNVAVTNIFPDTNIVDFIQNV